MLAVHWADVAELSARARAQLATAGLLGTDELRVPVSPYAERAFAVGDLVLARRNHYPLGLVNGARGRVSALEATTGTLTVAFASGSVRVPAAYLAGGGLDHGYALTVH